MTTADGSVIGSTQIFGNAPRNRAFNVVLLADGFRASEQNTFDQTCMAFVESFRGTPPFNHLGPAINVFRVNVSSTDSGADDPVSGGGTGATARTYFDSSFGGNGIRRLLVCNATTVLQVAAAQVPEFSVALLVVNSSIYGGSGGSVGTFSLASSASEIAIHEMGHTAFGLADEYPYYAGGNEPGHDHHPPQEPAQPNVTTHSALAGLKWAWAVTPGTPVPTMTNPDCSQVDARPSPVPSGTVGLFEGAHYYHCGAFRPEYNCKMRSLDVPFCAVCRAAISSRIEPLMNQQARKRTAIEVVARYPEHLDVFAVGEDGRTVSNWWDQASGWAGWFQVQGGVASSGSPVTTVARYAGHLDLFTVGTDNHVYSAYWDASDGWHGWFRIGDLTCRPGSTVHALARYSDHLDLFTVASDGRVMSTWWDARSGWGEWFQIRGGVAAQGAQVTAVARHPSHLDVFTVGTDNQVHSAWWDERSGWHDWFSLPGATCRPDSTVTALSRFADQLDLFTTASDGRVMSTWWNVRSGWGSWFQVSNGMASPGSNVTAIARHEQQLDLFVVGPDNRIHSTWWREGSSWASWFNVSNGVANPGGQIAAIARFAEHIDLFAVGPDGLLYSAYWDASGGWRPWFVLGAS